MPEISLGENPEREFVPGSKWRHYNGLEYTILFLTNLVTPATEAVKYPLTVVYENLATGSKWSRPAHDWHRSMQRID